MLRTVIVVFFILLAGMTLQEPLRAQVPERPRVEQTVMQATLGATARGEFTSLNQIHVYVFRAEAGQFIEGYAEQMGVDISLKLVDPDDTPSRWWSALTPPRGPERLRAIAPRRGEYALLVRPSGSGVSAGAYSLRITTANPMQRDRILVLGDLRFSASKAEFNKPNEYENMMRALHSAQEYYRQAGDPSMLLLSLIHESTNQARFNKPVAASRALNAALAVRLPSPEPWAMGYLEHTKSIVADVLREKQETAYSHQEAANRIWHAMGAVLLEGSGLINLSNYDRASSNYARAKEHGQAALDLFKLHGIEEGFETAHYSLGSTALESGDFRAAVANFEQCAKRLQGGVDTNAEIAVYLQLGTAYHEQHDRAEARKQWEKAHRLAEQIRNSKLTRDALEKLASIEEAAGKRFLLMKQVAALAHQSQDPMSEARAEMKLADMSQSAGESFVNAREHLDKAMRLADGRWTSLERAWFDNLYGTVLMVYALTAEDKDGQMHRETDKVAEAHLLAAYAELKKSRSLESAREAVTGLGYLAMRDNRQQEAVLRFREALPLLEGVRSAISTPTQRGRYLGSARDFFEIYIRTLMKLGKSDPEYIREAFEVAERDRARMFLDELSESKPAPAGSGVAEYTALADELAAQDKQKNGRELRIIDHMHDLDAIVEKVRPGFARSNSRPASAPSWEKVDVALFGVAGEDLGVANGLIRDLSIANNAVQKNDARIDEIIRKMDEVRAKGKVDGGATLGQQAALAPADLKQVKDALRKDQQTLLYFHWSAPSVYVWVATGDKLQGFSAGDGVTLKRLVDEVTAMPNTAAAFRDHRERAAWWSKTRCGYFDNARKLSQLLLGEALASIPSGRIVIAADGPLTALSFASLPDERLKPTCDAWTPLIARYQITYQPSATAIVALSRDAPKRLFSGVVVADPISDEADDPRLPASVQKQLAAQGVKPRYPRNTNTFKTLDTVVRAAKPGGAFKSLVAFEASRGRVLLSPEIKRATHLFLGAHGFIDLQQPLLSGIALSAHGRDGKSEAFLRGIDMYSVRWSLDFVGLASCGTAYGPEPEQYQGEGALSFSRSLLYSGAKRVLAPLWNVDDEATEAFLKKFYGHYLTANLPPAEALRKTQLEMASSPKWNSPFFWGAFVLQGRY